MRDFYADFLARKNRNIPTSEPPEPAADFAAKVQIISENVKDLTDKTDTHHKNTEKDKKNRFVSSVSSSFGVFENNLSENNEPQKIENIKKMFRLMATNAELCAEFESEVEERLSIIFENDERPFDEIETDIFTAALSRAQHETANRWLIQNRVKISKVT